MSDVLIDVVGYVAPAPASLPAGVIITSSSASEFTSISYGNTEVVETLTFTAPSAGSVIVNSTAAGSDVFPGGKIFCGLTDDAVLTNQQAWESAGSDGSIGTLSGTQTFEVAAGPVTIELRRESATSNDAVDASVSLASLTAVFSPS